MPLLVERITGSLNKKEQTSARHGFDARKGGKWRLGPVAAVGGRGDRRGKRSGALGHSYYLHSPARSEQVVYAVLAGITLLAALLEWLLWLAAFLYCLYKVYEKAEHWSIKALAMVVGTIFLTIRYVSRTRPHRAFTMRLCVDL